MEVLKKLLNDEKSDVSELNSHPGFATSIFVSWDSIADYFELFDQYDLHREDESSEDLINRAFTEARDWARDYVRENDFPPSDKQILLEENKILRSLKERGSVASALSGQFEFHSYIKQTNAWSHSGAKDPRIFGVVPDPGKSIDYILSGMGITFTIYPPFMIPYTEMYYRIYEALPEWNYEDLDGTDVVETIFTINEANGNELELDLSEWEEANEGGF